MDLTTKEYLGETTSDVQYATQDTLITKLLLLSLTSSLPPLPVSLQSTEVHDIPSASVDSQP